jgi:hypothetical protein
MNSDEENVPDPDPAPDFPLGRGKPGMKPYPGGGAKVGPAWRAMWGAMGVAGDQFTSGEELEEVGACAGDCEPWTAKLLLVRAANAGLIERDYELIKSRRRIKYRRFGRPDA